MGSPFRSTNTPRTRANGSQGALRRGFTPWSVIAGPRADTILLFDEVLNRASTVQYDESYEHPKNQSGRSREKIPRSREMIRG